MPCRSFSPGHRPTNPHGLSARDGFRPPCVRPPGDTSPRSHAFLFDQSRVQAGDPRGLGEGTAYPMGRSPGRYGLPGRPAHPWVDTRWLRPLATDQKGDHEASRPSPVWLKAQQAAGPEPGATLRSAPQTTIHSTACTHVPLSTPSLDHGSRQQQPASARFERASSAQ